MITYTVTMLVENCCVCGLQFGLETNYNARLRAEKRSFFCPNGHSQRYRGESDAARADRLAREIAAEQERTRLARVDVQHERMMREKAEARFAAKIRRVKAGVCLDCNRTFRNVQRHRASKHGK